MKLVSNIYHLLYYIRNLLVQFVESVRDARYDGDANFATFWHDIVVPNSSVGFWVLLEGQRSGAPFSEQFR